MQVAGNFHFAPGKSFQQGSMHVHDLVPFRGLEFDTSHIIDKLSFGMEYPGMTNPLDKTRVSKENTRNPAGRAGAYQYFLKAGTCCPGASATLKAGLLQCCLQVCACSSSFAACGAYIQAWTCTEGCGLGWMQVVPTTYVDSHNRTINSNQYSVTEHFKPTMDMQHAGQLPGVFIFYDLSPIKVAQSLSLQAPAKGGLLLKLMVAKMLLRRPITRAHSHPGPWYMLWPHTCSGSCWCIASGMAVLVLRHCCVL